MIYIIENETLRVKVSSLGAELQSVCRTDNGIEYLWQGHPDYWGRKACNLFPICGRLAGGCYEYNGKTYEMGAHGFARNMEWSVLHQKADAITLQLLPTEETLAQYPFRFALEMTYSLSGSALSVTTIVHNEDEAVMPFAVGGHPGFNVPLTEGEVFEDYYVTFDTPCAPQWLDLDPVTCGFTGKYKALALEEGQYLPLHHDLFDGDAIFMRDMPREITLKSRKSDHSVRVEYPDSPYVGLWHNPQTDAPFVCIEPWVMPPAPAGTPEKLTEKDGMVHLEPGAVYRNTYTITVE